MRILHTSDWHLGRALHGHSLLDDQAHALDQLLALVRSEQVELFLLAGDVYDRSQPPEAALKLFDDFLGTLIRELKVPAVVISGNHDSAVRLGFGASLLRAEGLYLQTDLEQCAAPIRFDANGAPVDVFALPYASPERVRATFPDAEAVRTADDAMAFLLERLAGARHPERLSILMSHCFVAGGFSSESERPLSVGGSDQVGVQHFEGFDYVALGHLHRPHQQLRETVRYSGSLLKYSVSEADHEKSVVLFDLDRDGVSKLKTMPIPARRNLRVLEGTLEQILAAAVVDEARDDYVQILLSDSQALHDVHGRLAKFYPHRLQVLRQALAPELRDRRETLAEVQRGELKLFEDFYRYSCGRPPNDAEQQVLEAALAALNEDAAS